MGNILKTNMQNDILISICIATFNREKMLKGLLVSLVRQILPENIHLEIIVTDNNPNGSALSIVKQFPNTEKTQFKYFIQPLKNISITRNVCVQHSNGRFICFIDDDETASDTWINNLYNAIINYNSDGIFGYVEPIFDKDIPAQFHKREFYFSEVGETGTKAKFYYTTNAIIKSELIKSEEGPFDPSYGLTGGEDVHLFERLETKKNAKFNVSREAITYEYIPLERGNEKYLFNRALRGGQAFARRRIEKRRLLKFEILIKSLLTLGYATPLLFLFYFNRPKRLRFIQIIGSAEGKLRTIFNKTKIIY